LKFRVCKHTLNLNSWNLVCLFSTKFSKIQVHFPNWTRFDIQKSVIIFFQQEAVFYMKRIYRFQIVQTRKNKKIKIEWLRLHIHYMLQQWFSLYPEDKPFPLKHGTKKNVHDTINIAIPCEISEEEVQKINSNICCSWWIKMLRPRMFLVGNVNRATWWAPTVKLQAPPSS